MWRGYSCMHAHIMQLRGPQGHLSSDRSHCKEAAARTTCQGPPTHIVPLEYKSITVHRLTARHLGLKKSTITCVLSLYNYSLC